MRAQPWRRLRSSCVLVGADGQRVPGGARGPGAWARTAPTLKRENEPRPCGDVGFENGVTLDHWPGVGAHAKMEHLGWCRSNRSSWVARLQPFPADSPEITPPECGSRWLVDEYRATCTLHANENTAHVSAPGDVDTKVQGTGIAVRRRARLVPRGCGPRADAVTRARDGGSVAAQNVQLLGRRGRHGRCRGAGVAAAAKISAG